MHQLTRPGPGLARELIFDRDHFLSRVSINKASHNLPITRPTPAHTGLAAGEDDLPLAGLDGVPERDGGNRTIKNQVTGGGRHDHGRGHGGDATTEDELTRRDGDDSGD